MDIINFAKSDLGVAIAWIATVLSLVLTIWAMFTKQTLKVENINLKQSIQTLKQELTNKEVNQIGKNNSYIEKNKGGVHFN
ncbi:MULTISPECIES: hypothetical protein [Acinetobacter]|uniref:Uncharacterized protein n=1 Tax=Acinetobacter pittii TaxID=48296 RepID=A0A429JUA0_ACIPI|nr:MULTISPECIES: hypothetical protein [Acinetobacter]EHU2144378.1 hypothetical protein [Acinetobacter baumannii]EHU2655298.1 hypothetical protein [Acinetobacter baumannii]EHU2723648.1 hypothetical protein [Acinetobacter baumannii]EHU2842352.1 hypothetical protein [Acinetobacter baumannii]EHU3381225.1 hypothetical protein [Acinetobacter baumannii]